MHKGDNQHSIRPFSSRINNVLIFHLFFYFFEKAFIQQPNAKALLFASTAIKENIITINTV